MIRVRWYPDAGYCLRNPGRTWRWSPERVVGINGEWAWFWGWWVFSTVHKPENG